jgi:hypothetical protein
MNILDSLLKMYGSDFMGAENQKIYTFLCTTKDFKYYRLPTSIDKCVYNNCDDYYLTEVNFQSLLMVFKCIKEHL